MQFVVLLSEHVPHNADDGDAYDSIPKTAYEEIETDAHQTKKGDLVGVYVYKFDCVNQQFLLAYEYDPTTRVLLLVGTHENFYRNLKR